MVKAEKRGRGSVFLSLLELSALIDSFMELVADGA
jgi:hypothetical protein